MHNYTSTSWFHILHSSFKSSTCGVLKCCGPVACKLNICVYVALILGTGISVDSVPALQALKLVIENV